MFHVQENQGPLCGTNCDSSVTVEGSQRGNGTHQCVIQNASRFKEIFRCDCAFEMYKASCEAVTDDEQRHLGAASLGRSVGQGH